jgi:hypothetical protein|tara:strand:+ start:1334 stop:1570 length:237 start_codon:yes stop_codon:yes gene_type:complete
MGGIFGSRDKAPPVDPEIERLRKEAEATAAKEKADLIAKEKEEKLAVERRLRGSRSLFTSGTSGFDEDDDDLSDTLGG